MNPKKITLSISILLLLASGISNCNADLGKTSGTVPSGHGVYSNMDDKEALDLLKKNLGKGYYTKLALIRKRYNLPNSLDCTLDNEAIGAFFSLMTNNKLLYKFLTDDKFAKSFVKQFNTGYNSAGFNIYRIPETVSELKDSIPVGTPGLGS